MLTEATEANRAGWSGPLVAVVDDDVSFVRSVGRLLRSAGFSVQTFGSGGEFLSALAGIRPQCLVLDVHMPGMTGLQLQEKLAAEGYRVPVIFVTAYDTPQTREHAEHAGSFGILLKPFGQKELLDAIRRALKDPSEARGQEDQGPRGAEPQERDSPDG